MGKKQESLIYQEIYTFKNTGLLKKRYIVFKILCDSVDRNNFKAAWTQKKFCC